MRLNCVSGTPNTGERSARDERTEVVCRNDAERGPPTNPRVRQNRRVPACPTIETERLILRPFTEADLAAYTRVLQHPAVRESLRLPDTIGEFQAWEQMAAFTGQWVLRGTGQWALEEKSTGAFVGRAGTHAPHREDWPGVEVGWTLHPDHWGKGYATEAGRASVNWAFSADEDRTELYSMILTTNTRSQAVAMRLGFEPAETRNFRWYPDAPHTRWHLPRERWLGHPATAK